MKAMEEQRIAEHIGQVLDRELGNGPGADDLEFRQRELASMMRSAAKQPAKSNRIWVASVAAAIAALLAVGLWTSFKEESLSFMIGGAGTGELGSIIKTDPEKIIRVEFDNGSKFEIAGSSLATVARADEGEVRVRLLSGTVSAQINKAGSTRWVVQAGAYSVTAIGTAFDVSLGDRRDLKVSVSAGTVLVEGGELDPKGVNLSTGRCMDVSASEHEVRMHNCESLNDTDAASANDSDTVVLEEAGQLKQDNVSLDSGPPLELQSEVVLSGENIVKGKGAVRDPSVVASPWRISVKKGNYGQALELLSAADVTWISRHGNASLLWNLAKAARYKKRSQLAMTFLQSLRKRFSAKSRAKTSAFVIAKINMDQLGNNRAAIKWLEIYLSEQSRGALAEEAIGNLMKLHQKVGNETASQKYAKKYLNNYPGGAFSKHAQRIVYH